MEFNKLKEKMENLDLGFGDSVRITGTYSEYVPFINMTKIVDTYSPSNSLPLPTCGPCKTGSLHNVYCSALLGERDYQIHPHSSPIPLFCSTGYSASSIKILKYSTGMILEIEGQIVPIPDEWKDFLVNGESFTFAREDESLTSFGIKVDDCDLIGGHLDRFDIDMDASSC